MRRRRIMALSLVAFALPAMAGCAASKPASSNVASEVAQTAGPSSPERASATLREYNPDELVELTLIADAAAIAPGQQFTAAARFDIAPGWHLYWENPGESGLATELEVSASDGTDIGPVRYPGPIAFTSPGPVVSYGYADDVLLSFEVRAPAESVADNRLNIAVDGYWLACREVCVRGQASTSLALEIGSVAPAPTAQQERFKAHAARLPTALTTLAGGTYAWQESEAGPSWQVRTQSPAKLSFFPDGGSQLAVIEQSDRADGNERTLTVTVRSDTTRLQGVLAVGTGRDADFYIVDVSP